MSEGFYGFRLLLVLAIVLLNGFFAGSETALVSSRRSRLRHLAQNGSVGAQSALTLLDNPERLLSVSQVGITLSSLLLGWAGEDTLSALFAAGLNSFVPQNYAAFTHGLSFACGFVLMSYMHVLIGEVVPKNVAFETKERLAVLVAPVLLVVSRIFSPLVAVTERSAMAVSRALGLHPTHTHASGHSPDELKYLISSSREEGHLEEFEEQSIHRLISLREYIAREIMTPRSSVASINADASLDQVLRKMIEFQYSRLPVYDKDPEKIIGVVHYKDLLRVWEERRLANARRLPSRAFRLELLVRKPLIVPETKTLNQLLNEFRHSTLHMAIVVDEFGTISGIVTLEDVVEQIFGEIQDEHDEQKLLPALDEAEIELEGTTSIVDLDTHYGLSIPTDAGFETLAGFLLYKLGRLPETGEVVQHENLRFTVLQRDRNRIARVKLERLNAPAMP